MTHRAVPYGDRAWLVECAGEAAAVAEALRRRRWEREPEVVVGVSTCLIRFPGAAPDRAAVESALAGIGEAQSDGALGEQVLEVPVRYDGDDLAHVAAHAGCSVHQVISLHTSATFRVAFLGFAPGFAYLLGLPRLLQLPRREVPRVRVPAGSVALADRYSAVYPRSSPGGWHLIGTTDLVLFDPDRRPASLLRPGMTVRFREAG